MELSIGGSELAAQISDQQLCLGWQYSDGEAKELLQATLIPSHFTHSFRVAQRHSLR